MTKKLEYFALGILLAPVAPLAGALLGWWSSYTFLPENWIPYASVAGLLAGILVDVFLLRRLLDSRPSLPLWGTIHLFYSFAIFGFFMGVPVANAALAIPAGFVIGSRLAADRADAQQVRKTARRTAWFTSGVLALICAASAFIALVDPYTAGSLEGMLGLDFEVTRGMIIALILVGGAVLLAAGWGLTVASVRLTCLLLQKKT